MKKLLVALVFILAGSVFASITSTTDRSGPFTIAGLPQTIPTTIYYQQGSDLLVLDMGTSGSPSDPAVTLTLGSDYTVSGGGYNVSNQMQTGSITMVSTGAHSVAVGHRIVIMRNAALNQTSSFTTTGPLTMQQVEQALDKQATLSQQVNEVTARSLRFENFETASAILTKSARAGKILGFDSNGDISYSTGGGGSGSVTSVGLSAPAFLTVGGSPVTNTGTLALTYSGTALPVPNGGSGAITLTAHGVLVGNGVSAIAVTGTGNSGQVLTSNGASADPTFQTVSGTGTVTTTGSPSSGQTAEFTSATAITGVATTGTGSYVKATAPTFTTTSNVFATFNNTYVNGAVISLTNSGTQFGSIGTSKQVFGGSELTTDLGLATGTSLDKVRIGPSSGATFSVAANGAQILGTSQYLNFGANSGTSGYGFRDNSGSMEFKNSGGSWGGFSSGVNTQDVRTGDGSTTVFTLTAAPASNIATISINGVAQLPTTHYTISGTTLTFVTAPTNTFKILVTYPAPSGGGGGSGTVTSVAASVPSLLSISGSPITTSGTLAITYSGTALPVANGGSGATTLTAHGVVVGNGTSAVAITGAGTSGQVLTSNGASADPTFQTVSGTGTVTSVAVSVANGIGVSGSPITTNGTIALSLGAITPTSVVASAHGQFALLSSGTSIAGRTDIGQLFATTSTASSGTAYGFLNQDNLTASANGDNLVMSWHAVNSTIAKGAFTGLNYLGMSLGNPAVTGAGTIDNQYQIYINTPTRGTTNYSIYSAGGINQFLGGINSSPINLINSTSPTTSAVADIAFDTNAWASGRGAIQINDGTANTYVVAALASDTPTNGQVPTWNTGGTVTWETPSGGGGSPGGSSTQVQVNSSGSFGASSKLTADLTNYAVIHTHDALGSTTTSGLTLTNTTAGTSGTPIQISPALTLTGSIYDAFSSSATTHPMSLIMAPDSTSTSFIGATIQVMEGSSPGPKLGRTYDGYPLVSTNEINFLGRTGGDLSSGHYIEYRAGQGVHLKGNFEGWVFEVSGTPVLTIDGGSGAIVFGDPIQLPKTVTAGGTTGAQTINKTTGSVNFAAAATSLVVTNSLVATSSIIICTVGTNDTTCKSVQAVAASGSFTIYPNVAPTAETRVNFIVSN